MVGDRMGSTSNCSKHPTRGLGRFILDTLARLFGFGAESVQSGRLDLGHGRQEIKITLHSTPWAVWTSFKNTANVPVCVGDVDMLGVQIVHNGFVIYADIKSVSRHIRWFANMS